MEVGNKTKGFDLNPYKNGNSQYIDLGDYSYCSDCGKKHVVEILSQIEYFVCEKNIHCEGCGHNAYFGYGQVFLNLKQQDGSYKAFQISSPDNNKVELIHNDCL